MKINRKFNDLQLEKRKPQDPVTKLKAQRDYERLWLYIIALALALCGTGVLAVLEYSKRVILIPVQ